MKIRFNTKLMALALTVGFGFSGVQAAPDAKKADFSAEVKAAYLLYMKVCAKDANGKYVNEKLRQECAKLDGLDAKLDGLDSNNKYVKTGDSYTASTDDAAKATQALKFDNKSARENAEFNAIKDSLGNIMVDQEFQRQFTTYKDSSFGYLFPDMETVKTKEWWIGSPGDRLKPVARTTGIVTGTALLMLAIKYYYDHKTLKGFGAYLQDGAKSFWAALVGDEEHKTRTMVARGTTGLFVAGALGLSVYYLYGRVFGDDQTASATA